MPDDARQQLLEETVMVLGKMQQFDAKSLPRLKDLGTKLSFDEAVFPAERLINLYQKLPSTVLEDFTDPQLTQIKNQAELDLGYLQSILSFDPGQDNASATRTALIDQPNVAYNSTFPMLSPYVAYSLYKTADFRALDREARETIESINGQVNTLMEEMASQKQEADNILTEVRKTAEEQGVTQQAIHFKTSADNHTIEAETWRKKTVSMAWVLFIYAFISLFLHKIPLIAPEDSYQTVQLAVSKLMIFGVISFMLYLSAKNFLSHKHNAVIDAHRENALKTYKALVEAGGDNMSKEAVLIHAAACIFSPQQTGYAGDGAAQGQGSTSVIELLSKPLSAAK